MANEIEKTLLLGKNIAKYRKLKKLSQIQLAIKLEISREHLGHIEVGIRRPSFPLLFKIAQILDVKEKDLLDFED